MEKEAFFSIYDLLIACYAISMVLLTWCFFFNQKNIAYVLELKEQISRLETEHQKELAKATLKAQDKANYRRVINQLIDYHTRKKQNDKVTMYQDKLKQLK